MKVTRGNCRENQLNCLTVVKHKFKIHSLTKTTMLKNRNKTAIKRCPVHSCFLWRRKEVASFEQINNTILEWFSCPCSRKTLISGHLLQDKAYKFASDFSTNNFTHIMAGSADSGFNIVFWAVWEESDGVNQDDINRDEIGLFYIVIPHKTLNLKQ